MLRSPTSSPSRSTRGSCAKGASPARDPRVEREDDDLRLERKPSEYFDRLYVAAISYEPYLADIVRQWGDHRLLIGSDFDHADPIATWPDTVRQIRAMDGLSKQDQDMILGGNAARLFAMETVAAA